MRKLWFGSLGLWFATAVSPLAAEELQWKAATLGKPVPAPIRAVPEGNSPNLTPQPRVSLGAPRVQLGAPSQVIPVGSHSTIFRAQDPGASLPLGQPRRTTGPQVSEMRNGELVPMPTNPGTPRVATPMPNALPGTVTAPPSGGTLVNSTVISESVVEGPMLSGPGEIIGGGGCATGECPTGDTVLESGMLDEVGLPPQRFMMSAEYLSWWTKGTTAPALATNSPVNSFGIIGQPGTTVVAGGQDLLDNRRDGMRFRGVWWCDPCQLWGIDASIFFTNDLSDSYNYSNNPFASPQAPNALLARPFSTQNFGNLFGGQFAEAVASIGELAGNMTIASESSLWGAELNGRRRLWRGCDWNVDGLIGYRYVSLRDTISITERIYGLPQSQTFSGTIVTVNDSFRTTNHFHGGQLGLTGSIQRGRWELDWRTSVALGTVSQNIEIEGSQNVLSAGTGTAAPFFTGPAQPGGLLALNSNIGSYDRNRFAWMPELGVNLNYALTPRLKAFVGYNFMYLSSVVRAADQIDTTVDINRVPRFPVPVFQPGTQVPLGLGAPGTAPPFPGVRPTPTFRDTDFWAQGISFGLKFDW
ncbi:BBP7 family outer membrane beta-barrel protein [Tuwongella immobilis]|uniref:BBP7 family outer membrane beta-barrel protein n=1 Tax=Tuwongella immobilis TaxID=692036 RepID=A0A6C2YMI2_9BACT|nr:BBP7 family outer membrane beta-barrel protein [Tuwongella immobilis]VIP02646.1 Signal peptide protein OS=Rhodopirellula europaea 6C GN=RE6C_05291 PE=4 SV=1: DUF1551 [Tuwongella immobilis]VTS02027.1 Signal peptide protein OS=Rhodopirellula europaea 6C GN=RE6C_05291 PE=4 SV=1: DUF1551 [Tuwongella immobilis]